MMDSFGLWSTYINEIFSTSFFLTGGLNGGVRFDFSSFFWSPGDTYLAITWSSVVRFSKFKGISIVFIV